MKQLLLFENAFKGILEVKVFDFPTSPPCTIVSSYFPLDEMFKLTVVRAALTKLFQSE